MIGQRILRASAQDVADDETAKPQIAQKTQMKERRLKSICKICVICGFSSAPASEFADEGPNARKLYDIDSEA